MGAGLILGITWFLLLQAISYGWERVNKLLSPKPQKNPGRLSG